MLYQDWVDDGLMVRIPDARGKNIDKYYNEELSDTQQQRIDNCTRQLWTARMPGAKVVETGPMWRQLRREIMVLRTCLDNAEMFDEMILATQNRIAEIQGAPNPVPEAPPVAHIEAPF